MLGFAIELGLTDAEARDEWLAFKENRFRQPHTDWAATWRRWCRNFLSWRGQTAVKGNGRRGQYLTKGEKIDAMVGYGPNFKTLRQLDLEAEARKREAAAIDVTPQRPRLEVK